MSRIHSNRPLGPSERKACDALYEAIAFDDARAFGRWMEEANNTALLIQISSECNPPLEFALHVGALRIIQDWRQWGLDPKGWMGAERQSLLHLATASDTEEGLELAQWLVEEQGVSLLTPDVRGKTPLHLALEKGTPAMGAWAVAHLSKAGQLSLEDATRPPMPAHPALHTLARLGELIGEPRLADATREHLVRDASPTKPDPDLLHHALTVLPGPRRLGAATLLVENGVGVQPSLAFRLWDTSRSEEDISAELKWALAQGAAVRHEGRNLLDEVLAVAQRGSLHIPSWLRTVQVLLDAGAVSEGVPPLLRLLSVALHPDFLAYRRSKAKGFASVWNSCARPVDALVACAPKELTRVINRPTTAAALERTMNPWLPSECKELRRWVLLACTTYSPEERPALKRPRL